MIEIRKQNGMIAKLSQFLWNSKSSYQSRWRVFFIRVSRMLYILYEDISDGQLTLRAMGLAFTTLLALVPLLAVSFSVLKALGVHNQIEPIMLQFLEPLGQKGIEINRKIIGFVENVKAGVLGSVGLLFLFYTVYSLINKIEIAFNHIWQLRRMRTLLRRFSDYLSVLFVGPVLVFSALGISAAILSTSMMKSLARIESVGVLFNVLTGLIPYLLIIAAFVFMYKFVPNTKVKFGAALVGGIVSGVVWQTGSWFFAAFVISSSNYTAIYSGFAILIFFMIWIYMNWLILLLGASLTFYVQYPENMVPSRHRLSLSILEQEKLSLSLLVLVGKRLYDRQSPATVEDFARGLQTPVMVVEILLEVLIAGGLLIETSAEPAGYTAAVSLDQLTVKQVLDVVRHARHQDNSQHRLDPRMESVAQVVQMLDSAMTQSVANVSIRQLLDGVGH